MATAGKASTKRKPKRAKKAAKAKKKGRGRMSARSDAIARMRDALESLPLTLVCEVMGVARQIVYEWVEKGAPRNEDGSFNLAEFVKWRLDELLNRSYGEADSPELERFRAARADIVEMDRDTRRGLLVPRVDQPNAFLDARRLNVEHRPAHDVKDVLDALRLQATGNDVVTGQFRHLRSSYS